MWDVQVEKQDLNKAGTPSLPPGGCHLSSTPTHPCLGCHRAGRRGHSYLSQVRYMPVDRPSRVGGASASRGSVVGFGCGSVRPGVELPCPAPMEVGESLEPEDSLGSWPAFAPSLCSLNYGTLCSSLLSYPASLPYWEGQSSADPRHERGMGNCPTASSMVVFDNSANLRIPPKWCCLFLLASHD